MLFASLAFSLMGASVKPASTTYSVIAFSSARDVLLRGDALGWMGIGIILVSGLAATYYNSRNAAAPATPEAAQA